MSDEPIPTPPPVGGPEGRPTEPQTAAVSPTTGLAPNVAAGLATILPPVTGIIFLILEKKDEFVKFWAMQSLFFGVAFFVINILLTIIGFIPLVGCAAPILGMLVALAGLILWVIAIIKAFQGERWLMPVIGPMVEKQLAASTSQPTQ